MALIDISSFLNSVLAGIIGNIIFAFLLIWGFQQFRYYYLLRLKFHNKTFDTYWKRFPNEIVQSVTCTVKGNVIKYKGDKTGNVDTVEGQFIMNPINLKIGEGFHTNKNSDGFCFLKIIIKDDNTFFVEAPYTSVKENEKKNKVGFRIYQAFIWRRNNN